MHRHAGFFRKRAEQIEIAGVALFAIHSLADSADALKNGQIDAAFIVAGAPTTAVTDLATTKDTYLVSLDSEHIAKLLETSDYYTETVIAKNVYFGD